MKKTLVTILVVILVVLALAVAGVFGFMWYRDNHVFVDGDAYPIDSQSLDLREEDISMYYYDSLKSQLPNCEILWNVPFQNGKFPNDTKEMTLTTLTEGDVALLLEYFPKLSKVDASQCGDYGALELLKAQLPEAEVVYTVSLGAVSFEPDTTELVLEAQDYDFDTLKANLLYLPDVKTVQLKMPQITLEQVEELRNTYPDIAITSTVELLGVEYDTETTELDLSALTSDALADTMEKLPMLPGLAHVNLTPAEGESQLGKEDIKTLMESFPEVVFDYSFDFFGTTISTADEEVIVKNVKIGDENETEVRLTLDLLKNCKRFVLDNCKLSDEVMAQIREDYRDRTKVVWRVYFGKGSSLTDATAVRVVGDLVDNNSHDLIYCENVRYADFGHNEWLDSCDFVAGMTDLEVIIISGAPIKSLEPFANCKKLRVLEAAFCEYLYDAAPLANCENLERVNISYSHITDLTPLDDLPKLKWMTNMYYPKSRVPQEEQDRFVAANPDVTTYFVGDQPYGKAWRYDSEGKYLPWYQSVRNIFKYDIYPNCPNHTGYYLDESLIVEE